MKREHIMDQKQEVMPGRTATLICWFFLIKINLLMMKKMRSDGLCTNWRLRQVFL